MLSDLLALNVFHFLLVFARLSVVFLLMPGISAAYVSTRIRLVLALLEQIQLSPDHIRRRRSSFRIRLR